MILEEIIGLLGKKRFEEYFEEYVKENVWFVVNQKNYPTEKEVLEKLKKIFMYVEYEKVDKDNQKNELRVEKIVVNGEEVLNNKDLTVNFNELEEMMENVENITNENKKQLFKKIIESHEKDWID